MLVTIVFMNRILDAFIYVASTYIESLKISIDKLQYGICDASHVMLPDISSANRTKSSDEKANKSSGTAKFDSEEPE